MSLSAFSQEDYPKKTVIGSDTLVLITLPQLTKINQVYLRLDYQHDISRSLSQENNLLKGIVDNNSKILDNCMNSSAVKDSLMSEMELQYDELSKSNKSLERKLKIAKLSGNSKLFIGGGVGAYLMFLFSKYVKI